MKKITQPIKYHGGKFYLAERIIALMPKHLHYVEPYFGGGAVLLAKDPTGTSEVVNDISGQLTDFWKCLQGLAEFREFSRIVQAIPFSEYEWKCRLGNGEFTTCRVANAVNFFVRSRFSRQGLCKDFATLSRNRTRRGMNEQASSWLTAVDGLPDVHERLRGVVILNRDALDVIRQQDGPKTLFYLDPPYMHETRAGGGYSHEMSDEEHEQLLVTLQHVQGKFLLSCYPSKLYEKYTRENSWNVADFKIDNKASGAKTKKIATERIITNF